MLNLEDIKKREQAATKAPWSAEPEFKIADDCRCLACWDRKMGVWLVEHDEDEIAHADALFIAHAREDIPALIAEVERLRAEIPPGGIGYRKLKFTKNDLVPYPDHWPPYYNGIGTPCDFLQGPCACGAYHKLHEWGR